MKTEITTLQEALKALRILSHDWSNSDDVIETLQEVKKQLRTAIMTEELFDLYDDVILSVELLYFDTYAFDGRMFTSALTRFGFEDFSRDDFQELTGEA